jgi:predicted DNA-binding WGR domain protein
MQPIFMRPRCRIPHGHLDLVVVRGAEMTVRCGRIGAQGQSKTKAFKDATAAQAQAAKLVAEKTKEGYVEKVALSP